MPLPSAKPGLLPPRIHSLRDLRQFQRVMSEALFRPLSARDGLQATWSDGRPTASVAAEFVKPNSRLTSVERLEIYARSYWFRVLDCLYEDYPGVRAILGGKRTEERLRHDALEFAQVTDGADPRRQQARRRGRRDRRGIAWL